jgi:copper transport protein
LTKSWYSSFKVSMRARTVVLGALASVWMCAAGSVTASAHTLFVGSDPADGGVVYAAPDHVNLDFSGPVLLAYSHATLSDSEGRQTVIQDTSISVDPRYATRLVVKLPQLGHDSYRLSFQTRDSADLHDTEGSIVFGVTVAPSLKSQAAASPTASWSEVVMRWALFSGLAGLVGGLLFALFLLPAGLSRERRAKAQSVALWIATGGAAVVLTGEVGTLLQVAYQSGSSPAALDRLLMGSDFGTRWLVSSSMATGAGLLTAWLAWNAHRGRPAEDPIGELRRRDLLALGSGSVRACLLAVLLAIALGMSGHVGASRQPGIGDAVVRAAHLLSFSVWAGGLVAIVAVLGIQRTMPAGTSWAVLKRFSPVAAVALLGTVVSGVLMSGAEVASITAALSTQYGLALILKIGLVGVVALFGLRHALMVARGPREGQRLPLRTLGLEAGGALLIVLFGAFLGSSPPAVGAQFDQPAPSQSVATQTVDLRDLTLRLSVEPNQPGRNLVAVNVINKRRPVPAEVQQVNVVIGDSVTASRPVLTATASQSGRYDVGAADLTPGKVGLTVWIIRAGVPPIQQTFTWSVPPAAVARHKVVVSDAPIAPVANVVAVALIGGGLLCWLWLFVMRPGRRDESVTEGAPRQRRIPQAVIRVLARAIPSAELGARH